MGRLRLSSIPALVVGLVCLWVLAGIAWSLRIVMWFTIVTGAMTAAGRRRAHRYDADREIGGPEQAPDFNVCLRQRIRRWFAR